MPAWLVPAIMGVASLVSGALSQRRQNKKNKEMAEYQTAANEKFVDKQNAYNAPASQMSRFQDAGLNPNLIYGQGNPGNQSSPVQYPDVQQTQRIPFDEGVQAYNATAMTQSQVAANNARTRQIGVLTQLNQMQASVLARNPLLNAEGYKAIIDGLKSTAEIKASESGIKLTEKFYVDAVKGHMVNKVFHEVELLEQRFRLGSLDEKIKAEVLNGKEFQNAILEVQKRFMTDGDITPQHILQFIQLLLMKSL